MEEAKITAKGLKEFALQNPAWAQSFKEWIEGYFRREEYARFLNPDYSVESNLDLETFGQTRYPLFIELPFALQYGLICEFIAAGGGLTPLFSVGPTLSALYAFCSGKYGPLSKPCSLCFYGGEHSCDRHINNRRPINKSLGADCSERNGAQHFHPIEDLYIY